MLVSLRAPAATHLSHAKKPLGLLGRIRKAVALRRERQSLLSMDAFLLRDIGLTREEALAEAARPIWDAPANWRV